MTLQPAEVIAPDAELWATGMLRAALADRPESWASDVYVGNEKPTTNRPRCVVIRRDGGRKTGVFDYPRFGVRVFADVEQEAADLARLVIALFFVAPGDGVCVATSNFLGPNGVPDASQFQKYFTFEAQLRCPPIAASIESSSSSSS